MKTLFDCTLNGSKLSALDESIAVTDVRESLLLKGNQRDGIAVEVRVCIHEKDPALRRGVMSKIILWASQGGYITISDRPGQQLSVSCTQLPEMAAADWTAELALRFRSTHTPWWESAAQAMVTGNGILELDVPGDAPSTIAQVILLNMGTEDVTEFRLHCDLTDMEFTGVTLSPGSIFTLLYQNGLLAIELDGESVLHCRTAQSSDELRLPCGRASTVYATAPGEPLQATFMARGRYA